MEKKQRQVRGRPARPVVERLAEPEVARRILEAGRRSLKAEDLRAVDRVHSGSTGYLAVCPRLDPDVEIDGQRVGMRRADGRLACPWAGCAYHNYLHVRENGNLSVRYPSMGPTEVPEPCSLDAADRNADGMVLDDIASTMNATRQAASIVEMGAMRHLRLMVFMDPELRDLECPARRKGA